MLIVPNTPESIQLTLKDRARVVELRQHVKDKFSECLTNYGYKKGVPGSLIPQNDDTVLFTGAATNTMKPYLHGEPIPLGGIYMIQTCMRTQNVKSLDDLYKLPEWASYFGILGAITGPGNLDELSALSWDLYSRYIGVDRNRLRIRIATKDLDLRRHWEKACLDGYMEFDGLDPVKYTHKYGIDSISGRNCNLAIVDLTSGKLNDVGNVIAIEANQGGVAAEIGYGVETTVKNILGLSSSVEASLIGDIMPLKDMPSIKLADALTSSIAILDTGIVSPRSRKGEYRGRILRQYLQSMVHLREQTGFSISDIRNFAERFEELEFGSPSVIPKKIEEYLSTYERLKANNMKEHKFNETIAAIINPLSEEGHKPRPSLSCRCEP